jgi:potassium efflux system protein
MTYLADMMRWGIDIKDRRWKHKNYIMTFLGNEAVDWLMRTLLIQNRNEAIEIAQIMMDRSIIHHVNFVEVFSDKPTLYRFFRVCFYFTFTLFFC